MNLKQRTEKLEQNSGETCDLVAVLLASREASRTGIKTRAHPLPPEWESSRNQLQRRIFAARRRVGLQPSGVSNANK
ncbi:MAG: hypothetical protein KKA88_12920 [Gammaproteobacteria bacterium]|nr:hypothetical protein [Gammaproteobacteria bacterium]